MAAAVAVLEAGPQEGPAADRVPTLTEVVELGVAAPPQGQLPDHGELVALVLVELGPRVEGLFEERLQEALAPALARAADGLIRDARAQLAGTLQALVSEAVTRVLDAQRGR